MAKPKPKPRAAADLFNNPILSDVTIKQIYKGKVREYRAHKAILCADSSYFHKAFTGNFRESTESVMEIHDDDPDQFEFLLKYLYTFDYDGAAIDKLAGQDSTKRMLFPIGLRALADKYDISCISDDIFVDLHEQMGLHDPVDDNSLQTLLSAHYNIATAAGGDMGEELTSYVLKAGRSFTGTAEYKKMVVSNPIFGADMALALERHSVVSYCRNCVSDFSASYDGWHFEVHCPYCGKKGEGASW